MLFSKTEIPQNEALRLVEQQNQKTCFLHMQKQSCRSAAHGYRVADQRLCFGYIVQSLISLNLKKMHTLSSVLASSEAKIESYVTTFSLDYFIR